MALVEIPGGLVIPRPLAASAPALDTTTMVLDASGEMVGVCFAVAKAGDIEKVGFRTGAVVQAQTVRASLQDLDASGHPDGVQDQFRDISVADTDDNVWLETGRITSDGTDTGTRRTVAVNQKLAIVFEHSPFNAGDIFRLAARLTGTPTVVNQTVYMDLKTGGTYTKNTSLTPSIALYYSDGSVYPLPGILPITQLTTLSYNSGSANPKRGLKFRIPVPTTIAGCLWNASLPSANPNVVLYDSDGTTALETITVDRDEFAGPSSQGWIRTIFPPHDLLANTYYYILIEPSTAANLLLAYMDVNAAALWDQAEGGQNFHYAERDAGAPAATTTRRPLISPVFSKFDDGAGSGGGMLVHPGMAGRMAA